VSCRYPNCHGSIFTLGYGYFSTKDQAIAAWNTRALPAAPQTGGWGGVAENVRTGGWGGITALPAAPMGVKPRVKCDWPHCRCHPALCEAPPQPLYTGAFSAPQPAPTLGDALELPEVRALSAALARIADLEAQLATAHADGYAAGVRDALERVTFPIPAYRSAHDSKPSELALTSIAALEAAAEDIVALLPPDSEKGGA